MRAQVSQHTSFGAGARDLRLLFVRTAASSSSSSAGAAERDLRLDFAPTAVAVFAAPTVWRRGWRGRRHHMSQHHHTGLEVATDQTRWPMQGERITPELSPPPSPPARLEV